MKNSILISLLALPLLLGVASCDKIEAPYPNTASLEIDTTLYPGIYADYLANEYPNFTTNENTLRNVLIEDYTGHTCFNCPNAAVVAENLHNANPERVFVATIHAGPGQLGFQEPLSGPSFTTDHTCPEGIEYGNYFASGFGFSGNPSGNVNRTPTGSQMFTTDGLWGSRTSAILSDNNLKINLQSEFNYFESTNGGFLHVEAEKLTSDADDISLVVYVILDSLVDWQIMPDNSSNPDYVHKEILIGTIDEQAWGQQIFTSTNVSGSKIIKDYSYEIPASYDKDNMHLLIYAYNEDTKEVYQVIKQKFTN
ncbi:MAG: Omp28-related outer membrane protein [Lishizhenia sp.]